MSHAGSKIVIYAAIAGNVAIAITKFIAAGVTGSSAMFSEGIHSLVDSGNGLLLLHGIKQSNKPADKEYPFGRGQELYFWTLIVAVMIFAVGGGISFYEGVLHVLDPSPMNNPQWNYIVLGFSIVFESFTWFVAYREFNKFKGKLGHIAAMRASKAPTTFAVLLEDTAALLGLIVALIGIALSHMLNMPVLDGVASIVIGLILAAVAAFLAYETKGLLIGESAVPETCKDIEKIAEEDPAVESFVRARTMHLGPYEILLAMDLLFYPEMSSVELADAIDRIEVEIRSKHPEIKYIYLEAKGVKGKKKSQN